MPSDLWLTDWSVFLHTVIDQFVTGLSDAEVSELFGGQMVSWSGEVGEKLLGEQRPAIRMNMPRVQIRAANGYLVTTDYLFLRLAADDAPAWRSIPTGTNVRFEATLRRARICHWLTASLFMHSGFTNRSGAVP